MLFHNSLIGQGVSLLSLPVIARIYPIQDVALFGLVMILSSLFQSVGILKLDLKIWVSKGTEQKKAIASAFSFVAISSMFFSIATYTLLIRPFVNSDLLVFVIFLLLNLGAGFASVALAICTYEQEFQLIARSQLLRLSLSGFFQIGFGMIYPSFVILITGTLLAQLIALLFVYIRLPEDINFANLRETRDYIKENWFFAKHATLESFFNSLLGVLPAILVSNNFGPIALGYYYVSERVLGIGNQIISENIRISLASKLSSEGNPRNHTKTLIIYTFAMMIFCSFTIVVYLFFGEKLISFGLGDKYAYLATFFVYVLIGWMFRVVSLPVYVLLQFRQEQLFLTKWSIIKFIAVLLVMIPVANYFSFSQSILSLNIIYAALSTLFIFFSWNLASKSSS